jgi:hypothetical protein
LALCLQTKALLLPLLPVLAIGLLISWPTDRRLLAGICLGLSVLAGVGPTLVARHRDLDRVMLADSGWFNAWVGLNEVSRTEFQDPVLVEEYSRYRQSARSSSRRAAVAREKIADLLRQRGLAETVRRQLCRQYFRLFHHESFLTHQLPGGVVHARGGGYRSTAALPAGLLRGVSFGAWAALLAMAAFGLASFPWSQRPVGWWVVGFLGLQCALFLVLHVKTRYRVQMLPALIFFAVYAAGWWRARWGEPTDARRPGRWAAGSALAALLLYLAFAP